MEKEILDLNQPGIYKIVSPSGKVYIGQAVNVKNRWAEYKTLSNCKNQVRLYRSLLKYGVDNHVFTVKGFYLDEELNKWERHWQDHYEVIGPNGLNCILTNSEDKPKVYSEESRKKISDKSKLYAKTEEGLKRLSNMRKGIRPSDICIYRFIEQISKSFKLVDPLGNLVEGKNFKKFCQDNGFHLDTMKYIFVSTTAHYKGWRLYRSDEDLVPFVQKYYEFICPDHVVHNRIISLADFCRERNLSQKSMSGVHTGSQYIHKGWRKNTLENLSNPLKKCISLANLKDEIVEFYDPKEFCKSNNLKISRLNELICGKILYYKGWRLRKTPKPKEKIYYLIDPNNNSVQVNNLSELAKKHGLYSSGLSALISGKISNHKKWKRDEKFYKNKEGAG